jgi:type IV secretory pathway VirB6-like protein
VNTKTTSVIVGIVLIAGFSAATALVVHHNDQTKNAQAMMMSDTAHKKAVQKAASDAAMKQKETDKMASQDSMMHDTGSMMSDNK